MGRIKWPVRLDAGSELYFAHPCSGIRLGIKLSAAFRAGEVSPRELCSVWGIMLQKDVDKLGRDEHRITRMTRGLKSMTSEGRLKGLSLFSKV